MCIRDSDYNWTRFSILEERAIYRMAHIKLANPKRALYSQVLLSNFMYSYLAKVQMMHPQMQMAAQQKVPQQQQQRQQAQQQQQQKSQGQGEDRQLEEYLQYQRWQEVSNITHKFSCKHLTDPSQQQQAQNEAAGTEQAAEVGSLQNTLAQQQQQQQGHEEVDPFDQSRQNLQYSRKGGDAYAAPEARTYLNYSKQEQLWGGDGQWDEEDSNMFDGLS